RRKIPVTSLLKALGMDDEEILATYYKTLNYERNKKGGWKKPFDAESMKNTKPSYDLIDAKTGKVVHEGGKKLSARQAKKLATDGLTHLMATDEDLYGTYIANDLINFKTGEIYAEAGDEIDEK